MHIIYDQEILDGIGDLIKSKASITLECNVKVVSPTESEVNLAKASVGFNNPNQDDLYYLHSILASVGWNKNDDVFEKGEIWKARNTPVDKPFNLMHDEDEIIGHITGSCVIDRNGDVIPDDTEIDKLPDNFDILSSAVIYKYWPDEEKRHAMAEIIDEINDNQWFVSMECVFPEFDYAMLDAQGNQRIIERNKETAFLSKYLRVYGGSGKYNDIRIGRLFRNLTFSGKGLVTQPAGPRSIIFNENQIMESHASENIREESNMNDSELNSKIVALEAKLAKAEEDNKLLQAKASEEINKAHEEAVAELNSKLAKASEEAETSKSAIAELQVKLDELTQTVASKDVEIANVKAELTKVGRASKLAQAGVEDEVKRGEILDKFASASEEMFDEIVGLYAEAKKAKSDKSEKADPDMAKEDKSCANEQVDSDEVKTPENLDVVEAPKEPALATAGVLDPAEEVAKMRSVAIEGLAAMINYRNKNKKNK